MTAACKRSAAAVAQVQDLQPRLDGQKGRCKPFDASTAITAYRRSAHALRATRLQPHLAVDECIVHCPRCGVPAADGLGTQITATVRLHFGQPMFSVLTGCQKAERSDGQHGTYPILRDSSGHLYFRFDWLQRFLPRQECDPASSARMNDCRPRLQET